ncbi:ArsA family ATPase [Phaeacidiphilus oryzae]|uniref:ArsA family ATPase n=1 Tax=Phaeacidiphilus oryzae TaxID=348818 RepID=UPI000563AADF|nr:ArsA-related P-loop ATPase [Phaeacidiphilus oryzae]
MSTAAETPPHTVVITGRGGAGRTTVAAATALRSARAGRRTLLVAADDPHRGLDELLGTRLGPVPGAVGPDGVTGRLHAMRLDPQAAFREEAGRLLGRAKTVFDLFGVEPLEEDELTALPGAGKLTLLRALREHTASGEWQTVVVDAPSAAETIGAFALPEQLARYVARLLPQERRAARSLRPILAAVAGVPMPADWLFEGAAWAEAELGELRAAAESPELSVRLVATPGSASAPELRLARAGLALYGHRVDAVIANRVVPAPPAEASGREDGFLGRLHAAQREELAAMREELAAGAATPLLELPHLGRDPRGWEDLARLADAADADAADGSGLGADGSADPPPRSHVEDRLAADGLLVWHVPLPGAARPDLDLVRRGDELLVAVGPYRRTLPLPSALRRCTVAGAGLRDAVLSVRFRPDPGLWPAARPQT